MIDQIYQETNITLNAVESYKSIKMEPDQRAFYEGEHLISEKGSDDEGDIFNPPKSGTEKYLLKLEQEKILKEKILAGTAPKIEIKEEYQEEPTHPYQIVFNKDISKYVIDKANERK